MVMHIQNTAAESEGTYNVVLSLMTTSQRRSSRVVALIVGAFSSSNAGAAPTATPDKAAEGLERKVSEYGFKGAVINGHNGGRYLDGQFFSYCPNIRML